MSERLELTPKGVYDIEGGVIDMGTVDLILIETYSVYQGPRHESAQRKFDENMRSRSDQIGADFFLPQVMDLFGRKTEVKFYRGGFSRAKQMRPYVDTQSPVHLVQYYRLKSSLEEGR